MLNQKSSLTIAALCPICVPTVAPENDLCETHKPTWDCRPFVVFGRQSGFGLYSDKFKNGSMPVHITHTEDEMQSFFYDSENQNRLQAALDSQKPLWS